MQNTFYSVLKLINVNIERTFFLVLGEDNSAVLFPAIYHPYLLIPWEIS